MPSLHTNPSLNIQVQCFYGLNFLPLSSSSTTHSLIYKYAKINTDSCSGLVSPPLSDAVFFWPSSSSNGSLLLWNIPTVRFLSFSSCRTPLFLSLAVFLMYTQYFLTLSTFLAFYLLVPGYFVSLSLYHSLALHHFITIVNRCPR